MQVTKYTFQSPSTSPVQVGRLDPSSVQKESSGVRQSAVQSKRAEQLLKSDVQQSTKVTPTVKQNSIDTYA